MDRLWCRNRLNPALIFSLVLLVLALSLVAGVCTGATGTVKAPLNLAPESALPDFVRDATPTPTQAWQSTLPFSGFVAGVTVAFLCLFLD